MTDCGRRFELKDAESRKHENDNGSKATLVLVLVNCTLESLAIYT